MVNTCKAQNPDLDNAILRTAAYADVFDYPLTTLEMHHYLMNFRASFEAVEQVLLEGKLLRFSAGYYTLPGREALAGVRQRRELTADPLWSQAVYYGGVIANLPFVRMVAVTGSLAMNNVESDPDIDYLIVTAPRWLWLTRALVLTVARRAAMRRVRICPNYLVTEEALVFPDQTLYTAHELKQMIPLFGMDVYARICSLNHWADRFLPNAEGLPPSAVRLTGQYPISGVKSWLEAALRFPPGLWLEQWEMKRKIYKLRREQGDSLESCFSSDYCKGHYHQHGQQTEQVLRERLLELHLEHVG